MPDSPDSLTRRELLRRTAALAAFAGAPLSLLGQDSPPEPPDSPQPPTPPEPPEPPKKTPETPGKTTTGGGGASGGEHVGVIGAGLAGLAAAQELMANGCRVTVLEGRPRLGGRAWTRTVGGARVDVGAEWVANDPRNPIMELARKFNLRTSPAETRAMILYGLDGKRVPPGRVARLTQRFARVTDQLKQQARLRQRRNEPDISLAEALGATDLYKGAGVEEIPVLDWMVARQLVSTAGVGLEKVSLKTFWGEEDANWYYAGMHRFDEGFGSLVDALAKGVTVRLSHVVSKVLYTNTQVRVTTNVAEFDFDRVVVTLPLGVLQAGGVAFEPVLPDWKTEAIKRLGVGQANRMVMRFDKAFWPPQVEFLGSAAAPSDRFVDWTNAFRRTREPVLSLWSAADSAAQLAALDDAKATAQAMAMFHSIFGDAAVEPTDVDLTRWGVEPLSLGAFPYMPVGAKAEDVEMLARPVLRRVFFAGDATENRYFHTAGAAVLSGARAAGDIAKVKAMEL